MKLVSDYRVRMTPWLYLMIIPMVVYFFVFKQYIYDLTVGGIIFMYWTVLVMFFNRYLKTWLKHHLAEALHFDSEVFYKTFSPKVVPSKVLSAVDVQKLEGYSVLMVMTLNFLAVMVCYSLLKDAYVTRILFGGFILSFNIHYSNICRIYQTVMYPNAEFEYNEISMKIYETSVKHQVLS
jgi:hypothetical protein